MESLHWAVWSLFACNVLAILQNWLVGINSEKTHVRNYDINKRELDYWKKSFEESEQKLIQNTKEYNTEINLLSALNARKPENRGMYLYPGKEPVWANKNVIDRVMQEIRKEEDEEDKENN